MSSVDFWKPDVSQINIGNANLGEAHFNYVNLTGADLRGANLYGTSSECTRLAEANVCSFSLTFARIAQARLETTKN